MTTEPTTSRHNPMKVIFNYQNVFFSFFYDDADACVHRFREYAMNYVLSGEMVLDDGYRQIHVGKGECVFIPRDHVQESLGRRAVLRNLHVFHPLLPSGDVRKVCPPHGRGRARREVRT